MSKDSKGTEFKMPRMFDKYTMQARVMPALIVILPLVLAAAAWIPKLEDTIRLLTSVCLAMGAVAILAHVARVAGKKAERNLLVLWGGWPSTMMLRYRDQTLNPVDKQRYHVALGRLVPGIKIPTYAEEEAAPGAADHVYEACCTWLRAQTVDEHRFHRLFAENISYGFRANLYGLRKIAIMSAITGALICIGKILVDIPIHSTSGPIEIVCAVACIGLTAALFFLLTPKIVREAADDYAKRLLAAVDELPSDKVKSRSGSVKRHEDKAE